MNFGLTADEYQYILKTVIDPIRALGGKVYCYGSRARGNNKIFSDLDLMVESSRVDRQILSQIQEQLSKSNFPYKVDLVHFNDFADSYKSTYQKEKVEF